MICSLVKGGTGGLKLLSLILLSALLPVKLQDSYVNTTVRDAEQDLDTLNISFNTTKRYDSSQSDSVCGDQLTAFDGNVICTDIADTIAVGHCMSHVDFNTTIPFSNVPFGFEGYIVARCPFFAGTHVTSLFIQINRSIDRYQFNQRFCSKLHNRSQRTGLLCSECIQGYGVDIFSPSYECRPCSEYNSSIVVKCLKILGVTILPMTVLFFIIMIFHIGLTSAPTNGYLFFSHVITIQVNVLLIETAWSSQLYMFSNVQKISKNLSRLLLIPHFIWTFDFGYIFGAHVPCVTDNIMHIISLQYMYFFYPLLLVILALVLIELHGRNCKLVVALWKPFCFVCVRLRRNWEVKTSLIDAFATFILLTYSKLVGLSLALICPNPAYRVNGTIAYISLHYGVSVQYLSGEHLPFFIMGIIGLSLGLLPPLLLLFYPFRWFQKVLNTLQLNRFQSLYIFVDAFQGCYKNGSGGSKERRFFAGLYFVFRFVVLMVQSITYVKLQTTFAWLVGVYISFLLMIAILQPYRKDFFNYLDACFFAIMALANANLVYVLGYVQTSVGFKLPLTTWPITYTLLLLPGTYMCLYVVYWIFTRSKARCHYRRLTHPRFYQSGRLPQVSDRDDTEVSEGDTYRSSRRHSSLNDLSCEMPDRVLNPHHYEVNNRVGMLLYNQSLSGSEASEHNPREMKTGSGSDQSQKKKSIESKYGALVL